MTPDLFDWGRSKTEDLAKGKEKRDEGIAAVADHSPQFLIRIRREAKQIAAINGHVSSDDLRRRAKTLGLTPHHQNVWGAIFKERGWQVVGRISSTIPSAHAREIKIWTYRKEMA